MPDSLIARRELDFLLHDWLAVAGEGAATPRDMVDAILDLSETLAVERFLPHYKQADREEPWLDADGVHILPAIGVALRHYAEAGLFSAGFGEEVGGLGLPFVACAASFALFAAANIATAAYPMLTTANARLIVTFGSAAQIEAFALPEIAGRWFGTMALSEPQAGSSLADVRTRATPDGEDALGTRYRLVGNKMWISGGDQDASENIVHLVLAKVPGPDGALPAGTRGLSLFIVPKILPDGGRNDVVVAGLNHKMGYRGTANCLLNLGEKEGAIGWMVGEPGLGLKQMFLMMNEARIGVGIGAAALACRGYRLSATYAGERAQGRATGDPATPPVAIVEHADVRWMLLAQKAYAEGALALCLFCAKLVDAEDRDSAALLGLLTPIAKSWSSEYGLIANGLAIQVHGGYGYTRDFDVEQLYRDNRLNPIHEGTTGIQAIDLLGRKILRDDGHALELLRTRIAEAVTRAATNPELASLGPLLAAAWEEIHAVIARLRAADGDALANAGRFLSAFGHGVVAWLWLEQALVAHALPESGEAERLFRAGKLRAARFFLETELPFAHAWLVPVAAMSDIAAAAEPAIFR